MTVHIGAKLGEIAETVLLPGDPYRAKWAAETFLDDAVCVNEVRGMLGYTGTWRGNRVTIHGTGMGMPSLSIYVNELIQDYGAKTLIRIGSCGAMQENINIRDVIIAMSTTYTTNMNKSLFRDASFAPCADWSLLTAAVEAAEKRKAPVHVGNIFSSDVFYSESPEMDAELERHNVLGVEMESAELYTLAARHDVRALAVLTVSDHLKTHEALPSDQRERSFGDMVEIALEAAFS